MALAAISGEALSDIGWVLKDAAAYYGVLLGPELRDDYDIKHWLRAVVEMGGRWTEAQSFVGPFNSRPTISDWMRANTTSDLALVFADDEGTAVGGQICAHVFAAQRGMAVDANTGGKRVEFGEFPKDLDRFRVKHVFHVTS